MLRIGEYHEDVFELKRDCPAVLSVLSQYCLGGGDGAALAVFRRVNDHEVVNNAPGNSAGDDGRGLVLIDTIGGELQGRR
jgi:hypothetical protein